METKQTTEQAHTPGPWFTQREGFSTIYVEARIGGGFLQEVAACGPTAEGSVQQEANARLIAAAPELLAAASRAEAFISGFDDDNKADDIAGMLRDLRASIAKATGSDVFLAKGQA